MRDVRGDFPILSKRPGLVYLDSACTSLKPRAVIDAESSYYTELGACGGRSSHSLGRETSDKLGSARDRMLAFAGAKGEELVWTRNATEALNIVANGFDYSNRPKVVTSVMEHHSVLLPFMALAERGIVRLEILPCDSQGSVAAAAWKSAIDKTTALVVTHSWNNTTGTGQRIPELARMAHDSGAMLCVDGAQGLPHHGCDFKKEGIDFLCFSGHKMLGPTGIGGLIMKRGLLAKTKPLMSGGGTVKTVSAGKSVPTDDHSRFEAGVQHYAGIIGLAAACDYLSALGMENVEAHEKALAELMLKQLGDAGAIVHGPDAHDNHGALYSFTFKGAKPHDVALMLDKDGVAVRSGFFCAQMAMEALGAKDGAARASAYIYNNQDDIRKLGEALQKIRQLY